MNCAVFGSRTGLRESSRAPVESRGLHRRQGTGPMNCFAHLSPQRSSSLLPDRWSRHSDFQPLASNSGFGSPVDSAGVQRPDLQSLEQLSPLERTVTENAPVSALECTLTKSLDLNSPGITFLQEIPGAGQGTSCLRRILLRLHLLCGSCPFLDPHTSERYS